MAFQGIPKSDSFIRSGSNSSVFRNLEVKLDDEKNEELIQLDSIYRNDCSFLLQKYPLVDLNSEVFIQAIFYNKEFEILKSTYNINCETINAKYIEKTKNFRRQMVSAHKDELALKKTEPTGQSSETDKIEVKPPRLSPSTSEPVILDTTASSSTTSEPAVNTSPSSATSEPAILTSTETTSTTSEPVVNTSSSSATSEPAILTSTITTSTTSEPVVNSSATNEPVKLDTSVSTSPANEPAKANTSVITSNSSESIVNSSTASSTVNITTPSYPVTYITIRFDAKFNNYVSICGNGPNMSWEKNKAIPLRNIGKELWVFDTAASFEQFEYKLLFNGTIWEKGPNHILRRDIPIERVPFFPI